MADNLAEDYGLSIIKDLDNLEVLAAHYIPLMDREGLAFVLSGITLPDGQAAGLLDWYDASAEDWDDNGGPVEVWIRDALEFTNLCKRYADGRIITDRLTVLVTAGGPHAEVEFDGGGAWACVSVRWGADHFTQDVYVPHVAERAWELAGALWGEG